MQFSGSQTLLPRDSDGGVPQDGVAVFHVTRNYASVDRMDSDSAPLVADPACQLPINKYTNAE